MVRLTHREVRELEGQGPLGRSRRERRLRHMGMGMRVDQFDASSWVSSVDPIERGGFKPVAYMPATPAFFLPGVGA